MKKKRKKSLKLILSCGLLFSLFSSKLDSSILPEKFKQFIDYKIYAKKNYSEYKLFDYIKEFHLRFDYYITDKGNVLEIRYPSKFRHPLIYAFDKNKNGKFEKEEYLRESDYVDGLNGNEIPLSRWEYSLRKYIHNK